MPGTSIIWIRDYFQVYDLTVLTADSVLELGMTGLLGHPGTILTMLNPQHQGRLPHPPQGTQTVSCQSAEGLSGGYHEQV